ncbi:MAG: DUF3501 family protein [Alphaproteobacteria bacterium]
MPGKSRRIVESDIVDMASYGLVRAERRRRMTELKRARRLEVGPFATFYFENYETMLHQVQEMLFIEKGGAAQLPDELRAYNPLIPQGRELVATVMFEIDDPLRRARTLGRLGGIEETAFIEIDGSRVAGAPEEDQDRTNAEGKASAVQFIHFPFMPEQIVRFCAAEARVVVGFTHPDYSHMAVMPGAVRLALAADFA